MADTIKIDATALNRLNSRLQELSRKIIDVRRPLKGSGLYMLAEIDKRFRNQGPNESGAAWAPLSPMTLGMRKHGGSKILQDSGRMRETITALLRGNTMTVFPAVDYAAKHHPPTGTSSKLGRKLADRGFMYFAERDPGQIENLFVRQINREIQQTMPPKI